MRISTQQLHSRALDQMLDLQRQTVRTQQQIATGRKFETAADDPLAAVRVERLNQELAVRGQYQRNIDLADSELRLLDASLEQAVNVLQRVRELAVQAGNPVNSAEDRRFIAAEISTRFDELMALMNTRLSSGDYLFGGTAGSEPPFVRDAGGGIRYQGDQGQRAVQIDGSIRLPVNDSGERVFVDVASSRMVANAEAHPGNAPEATITVSVPRIVDPAAAEALHPDALVIEFRPLEEHPEGLPNFTVRRHSDGRVVDGLANVTFESGKTAQAGGLEFELGGIPRSGDRFLLRTSNTQDVLTTVQMLADGLRTLPATGERDQAYQELLADSYQNLDNAMASILEVRSEIGARLNVMDSVRALHDQVELLNKGLKSDLQDADLAEAISDLNHQSLVLQAAQQSFLRVSRLSLFDAI